MTDTTPASRAQPREVQERRRKKAAEQLRGRANRNKGIRFERAVVEVFRSWGFHTSRTNEKDGFTRGWDIQIKNLPECVIQCKVSGSKHAMYSGLKQAREHNPKARLWVCIHSLRRAGKAPEIRVAYSSRPEGPPSITDLRSFIVLLQRNAAEGEYPSA